MQGSRPTAYIEQAVERVALDYDRNESLEEFFPPSFMREYTEFESFEAFCEAGPSGLTTTEPDTGCSEEMDRYVDSVTQFPSWRAMRNQAAQEETIDHLTV